MNFNKLNHIYKRSNAMSYSQLNMISKKQNNYLHVKNISDFVGSVLLIAFTINLAIFRILSFVIKLNFSSLALFIT